MLEQVFGYSPNVVMAWAAVANVALVVLLAAITFYYARHAKRQADANKDQVLASSRQAYIAQQTLAILREQIAQQRSRDSASAVLQIEAAIQMVDDWRSRISSASYPPLPTEIEILPEDFTFAMQAAGRASTQGSASYMAAAKLFVRKAETDLRLMRSGNPANPETWTRLRDRAAYNLNVARFKLDQARQMAPGLVSVSDSSSEAEIMGAKDAGVRQVG